MKGFGMKKMDSKSQIRRIDFMLKDLTAMKQELLPGEGELTKDDLKGKDKFDKQRAAVNHKLKETRAGIEAMQDIKRTSSGNGRDAQVIKQMVENEKLIKEASALWSQLKQIHAKALKKKKKDQEALLEERSKLVRVLGEELVNLINMNSRTKGSNATAEALTKELNDDGTSGSAKKSGRLAEKRAQRKNRRKNRRGGGKGDDIELDEPVQMSEQDQAFMDKRDEVYAEQDKILGEISEGLDELLEIGTDINKELKTQNLMINELGVVVDRANENIANANIRLKGMLEKSGGLTLWIPRLMCFILFFALLGYAYTLISE